MKSASKSVDINLEIQHYIFNVKSYLICDWHTKRKFINDLKSDIDSFTEEADNITIDDIYQHFGTPKDIAKGFFENADIKQIKKRINISKTIIIGIIAALIIWTSILLTALVHPYIDEPKSYFVEYMQDEYNNTEIINNNK